MTEHYGGPAGPSEPERPGPYQGPGVFGRDGADRLQGPGGAPGPGPGPVWPPVYGRQVPSTPPRQVTVASVISLILGGLCIVLGVMTMTSAGAQISETMTGSADAQGLLVAVILVCAAAYILPALYLRKRRPWARIMLIVVAVLGIMGGVMSLPASIFGLALHVGLVVMMLQQPTKEWFGSRR
jgi:hypothetical protein